MNKIWPRLWHESKPLLNRCPSCQGTGLFSERLLKRGSGWNTKLSSFHKRLRRGAVWMDRSNCRAGRSPGEAGKEIKEAQMSLCWTSLHSAAFKRWEHNATHVRMSWLLNICLTLVFQWRVLGVSWWSVFYYIGPWQEWHYCVNYEYLYFICKCQKEKCHFITSSFEIIWWIRRRENI